MQTQIELTTQPIPARPAWPAAVAGAFGAVVEFHGLVRGEEEGRPIAALEYEAYASMAERLLRKVAEQAAARNRCLFVRVIHRVGIIPAGEAAVYVAAGARHRAAAFAAVMEFMDQMKADVPIWKCGALPMGGAHE